MTNHSAPIILFLCTGNAARSIMAEALLNHLGRGRFRAYSAGSLPAGRVDPLSIETLRGAGIPADGLWSKGRDEFSGPSAPAVDAVLMVCDNAAADPVWPGHPASAHWGFADPATFEGSGDERREEFARVFARIKARIERFLDAAAAAGGVQAALGDGDAPTGAR